VGREEGMVLCRDSADVLLGTLLSCYVTVIRLLHLLASGPCS
jgi:hypothetical protein